MITSVQHPLSVRSTTVQRVATSRPKLKPSRDPEIRLYGEGCAAGRDAAIEAYNRRITPGGTWQHGLLDRLQIADTELRGFLVGYMCQLQQLSNRG